MVSIRNLALMENLGLSSNIFRKKQGAKNSRRTTLNARLLRFDLGVKSIEPAEFFPLATAIPLLTHNSASAPYGRALRLR